ncbi:unnamed protein product [Trichogramma brassicae]|uniref:C2HC/C3H-type domain-containing protein n=1 Tax=Trichogramma brassicae TaxID=86971 RepID=A0A6H5IHC3_9HYME|nr:unnamed protein product [Trichogramma brassicae]
MFSALGVHKITHRTATRSAKSMGVEREARVRQLTRNVDLARTAPRTSIRAYKGSSFAAMFSTRVHNGQSWSRPWLMLMSAAHGARFTIPARRELSNSRARQEQTCDLLLLSVYMCAFQVVYCMYTVCRAAASILLLLRVRVCKQRIVFLPSSCHRESAKISLRSLYRRVYVPSARVLHSRPGRRCVTAYGAAHAAGGCGGSGVDETAAAAAKDTMGPARCSVARFILDPMRRRNFKTVKSSSKNKRDQEADEEEERALKKLDDAVRGVAMVASTFGTFKGLSEQPLQATFTAQRVDEFADYYYARRYCDYHGRAESLEPCGVCGRKFNPRSLEKHMPICERTAAKKRKPFDSAKQRIKGTELAEFLPKQKSSSATLSSSTDHLSTSSTVHMGHSRRPSLPQVDDRPLPTSGNRENQPWRQKREEFIKAIRAARGEDSQPSSQPSSHRSNHHHHHQQQMQQRPSTLSLVSSHGAPQRANEKGQCPTCQRQFGVKSYDRHVAFCRERATRVPASPQVTNNVAKERLDARMKYRAPALKNRKLTMKEKYAPGGPHKVPQSPIMSRSALAAKEHRNEPKLPTLKRPSQTNKETPISSPATTPHSSSNNGPLKSRAIDRSNRDSDSQESLNLAGGLKQMFSSRRLLLLSEVLPSKILKSKLSMSSSSSQKSTSGLFPDLTGGKEQNCPEPPADGSKNLLRKLRKKSKLKKAEAATAAQSEEIDDKIDMITEDDFLAWKQAQSEKLKSNSNEGIELVIDKEDEPFNYDTRSSLDGGNSSTLDEFEHTERVTKYTEERRKLLDSSDGCEEKSQDFCEKKTSSKEEPVLNTTYVIDKAENSLKKQQQHDNEEDEEELKVTEINRQVEKIDIRADDTEDEDVLSNASTVTFVNKERSLVIAANEAEDYRLLKSNTADDAMMMTMMRDRIEQQQQLQQRSSKDGKKIEDNNCHESGNELPVEIMAINRPKKYHSLPNISDMRVKGADFLPAIVKVDKDDNNRSNLMADRIKPLLGIQDHRRSGVFVCFS